MALNMLVTSFFLAGQILFVIFFFFLVLAFVTGGPFVPSSRAATSTMVKLARVRKGMRVYDLGSGDGRLILRAAQEGAHATGFEINPILVLYANMRSFFSPYRAIARTRWQSLWRANLSDADVVFVYLLPWNMNKLAVKLRSECKPGTLVVSNSFIFPKWNIVRQDKANHVYAFVI
ncbi:hypothetical protein HY031_00215 [Candidatus Gottesmanbacteria bacterium]|nr:hypothetical protein [Candidatus Gottesmanbacteria bacterium]